MERNGNTEQAEHTANTGGTDIFSDDDNLFGSDGGEADTTGEEKPTKNKDKGRDTADPIGAAIEDAKKAAVKEDMKRLAGKPPVFEYAGAKEPVGNAEMTFEELRVAKSEDFPELEDGKRVSWTVEYLKTTRPVADPKKTTIAEAKADIEKSKSFLDTLTKSKDRDPTCIVKPRVTAQTKGSPRTRTAAYKGIFPNMEEAAASGKHIAIVPSRDGGVYEIRNSEMGVFRTRTAGDRSLDDIAPGFEPALPPIPQSLLLQIISFFRHFARKGKGAEALANIYWDREMLEYAVVVPKQTVDPTSVRAVAPAEMDSRRYIHYMDVHSHGRIWAFFSGRDDRDEKATRLYTVIGELWNALPTIRTRISNGGRFLEIEPSEVFEPVGADFPEDWSDHVKYGTEAGK